MFKHITKNLALALFMWIFMWLWLFITYATTSLISLDETPTAWDTLSADWYNDVKTRLINIHGNLGNVGIGTISPTQKLEVSWTVKATAFQWDWSALTWLGSWIPTWFIGSFYLSSCPTWWILADWTNSTPDMRWAFVRGMYGDQNSRDVARTLWSYQADSFASHLHSVNPPNTATTTNGAHSHTSYNQLIYNLTTPTIQISASDVNFQHTMNGNTSTNGDHTHTVDIIAFNSATTWWTETTSKNIALIYCMKQ